jgi:serine/threonine protein phosphatase PrpC
MRLGVTVNSYGVSDTGLVRANNEDAWAQLPSQHFFVLADGMGGHKAGEVASREAVDKLCAAIRNLSEKENTKVPVHEKAKQLQEIIERINKEVYLLSLQNENFSGMGTTLACIWIYDQSIIFAHVGDSRIYRFRKKKLTQLTLDHSLRQELLIKGELSESQAALYAFKNIITRAIGTHSKVQPDVEVAKLLPDDIYFMCSDGLTDELSFEEMQSILAKSQTIKEASDNLINAAKSKGGNDNITVVMVKIINR